MPPFPKPPDVMADKAGLPQRSKWDIDRALEALIGLDIRVAARSFSPAPWNPERPKPFIPVRNLILPDNTQPSSLQVFFEGKLQQFCRQVGVVYVYLEPLSVPDTAAEGTAPFRGGIAVILKGPAVVELAFPFEVERLPLDPDNYWRDVRVPCAQFEFSFSADGESTNHVSRIPRRAQ